jgi:hypothetical protein
MRRDGEPVRPGIGTTRLESRTQQSAKQTGTRSADTIKASGHGTASTGRTQDCTRPRSWHRINRPDTRLHPTISPHQQNPCNAGAIHTGLCPMASWTSVCSQIRSFAARKTTLQFGTLRCRGWELSTASRAAIRRLTVQSLVRDLNWSSAICHLSRAVIGFAVLIMN